MIDYNCVFYKKHHSNNWNDEFIKSFYESPSMEGIKSWGAISVDNDDYITRVPMETDDGAKWLWFMVLKCNKRRYKLCLGDGDDMDVFKMFKTEKDLNLFMLHHMYNNLSLKEYKSFKWW